MPAIQPEGSTAQKVARRRAMPAALAAALVLSACGGGFYWDWSVDESPPAVTLTTAVTSVAAGQTVRFVAAAVDENGIDHVAFYRVDATASVLLGRDSSAPYEWVVTAPSDGRTTLTVFARASDESDNQADSASVTIDVTP